MKRNLIYTISAFTLLSVLFMNCVKEYSYEGGAIPGTTPTTPQTDVTASYTLSGAPNTCTGATLTGNYISGISMNAGNTATVSVYVTAVGNYSLKTDTLDGISFSASGVFTKTGIQNVTMTANGTPERPDNISLTPSIGSSHCSFDIAIVNQDPVATYVLESGYGTPNPCIYSVAGIYKVNTALGSSNTITMQVFVTVKGNYTVSTNTVNGMRFYFTGNFTATGSQQITLVGSGTPVSAGTFSLIPQIVGPHPLGGQSCGVNITVQ